MTSDANESPVQLQMVPSFSEISDTVDDIMSLPEDFGEQLARILRSEPSSPIQASMLQAETSDPQQAGFSQHHKALQDPRSSEYSDTDDILNLPEDFGEQLARILRSEPSSPAPSAPQAATSQSLPHSHGQNPITAEQYARDDLHDTLVALLRTPSPPRVAKAQHDDLARVSFSPHQFTQDTLSIPQADPQATTHDSEAWRTGERFQKSAPNTAEGARPITPVAGSSQTRAEMSEAPVRARRKPGPPPRRPEPERIAWKKNYHLTYMWERRKQPEYRKRSQQAWRDWYTRRKAQAQAQATPNQSRKSRARAATPPFEELIERYQKYPKQYPAYRGDNFNLVVNGEFHEHLKRAYRNRAEIVRRSQAKPRKAKNAQRGGQHGDSSTSEVNQGQSSCKKD